MNVQATSSLLADQHFFAGMSDEHLDAIASCASERHFEEGRFMVLRGKPAQDFFLIRSGRVALEIHAGNKNVLISTVPPGGVIGWSWLEDPFEWRYDVRVLEDVEAIAFNANCVREKCESDPAFGYEMYKRFMHLVIKRLMASRVQLVDLYS